MNTNRYSIPEDHLNPPDIEYDGENEEYEEAALMRKEDEAEAKRKGEW